MGDEAVKQASPATLGLQADGEEGGAGGKMLGPQADGEQKEATPMKSSPRTGTEETAATPKRFSLRAARGAEEAGATTLDPRAARTRVKQALPATAPVWLAVPVLELEEARRPVVAQLRVALRQRAGKPHRPAAYRKVAGEAPRARVAPKRAALGQPVARPSWSRRCPSQAA